MTLLLSCQSLTKSYASRLLFRDITLGLSDGEKMGLIGPNGSGKSTLLRLLAGDEKPDGGEVARRRDVRLVYIPQEDRFPDDATVDEVLNAALAGEPLEDYEITAQRSMALARVGFVDGTARVETLSGGWKKRLALARALVQRPDLLLLDEPTNHLDLQGVLWLEELLKSAPFAFLLVSHDRYFLENVTNRVMELNRAYPEGYLRFEGVYSDFLQQKEEFLATQAQQQHAMEGKVKREIEWLRRGAQARTTKADYRIQAANKMIGELSDLKDRNASGRTVNIDFSASGRRTQELVVVKNIGKSLGGRTLFSNLSLTLSPGVRLGLLGPNGSGKSTLLRLLTGEMTPDGGTIKRADGLRIVLFDQNRAQLDKSLSLRDALSPNSDYVSYRGGTIHVSAWARRFLFRTEQLDMPVGSLSGGEQARILIANLMLQPADLLILDEPTNDLDIPSLEVLEDSLEEFPGTLVLVTHDRYMLDEVSTEMLALDGRGGSGFYADYAQWERAHAERQAERERAEKAQSAAAKVAPKSVPGVGRRLSTAEQRELNNMEETIMAAELEVESRQAAMSDPAVVSDHIKMKAAWESVQAAQERVHHLYARWEELEARKGTN
jgi:ABC transport system ATP-binding/permease protein